MGFLDLEVKHVQEKYGSTGSPKAHHNQKQIAGTMVALIFSGFP